MLDRGNYRMAFSVLYNFCKVLNQDVEESLHVAAIWEKDRLNPWYTIFPVDSSGMYEFQRSRMLVNRRAYINAYTDFYTES